MQKLIRDHNVCKVVVLFFLEFSINEDQIQRSFST